MDIPTYQEFMLPVLRALDEAPEGLHHKEFCKRACELAGVPPDLEPKLLPSGKQTYVYNRTGWAGWYMMQAGLTAKPKRGYLRITDEGKKLLATNPAEINNETLANYPSFVAKVINAKSTKASQSEPENASAETPDERIDQAFEELNESLASDILDHLAQIDPFRFEQLVVDLLFSMGYGGSRAEAARVTKKSADEGIDGVINEDRLGLDVIYIQAKRWQNPVGRKEIQSFVGALAGKQASKGVFISTSSFSKGAIAYADLVQQKVILIDGSRLAELMIEHNIGVSVARTFAVKRIDSDYFEEG